MQVKLVGEYTLSEFEMGVVELVDKLRENGVDEIRDVNLDFIAMDNRMVVDFVSETTGDIENWAFLAPRQLRDARVAK
ncbi:hypothetical protein [Croceicoccus marinus]|jgi:hypothetical protein|uniref:Uncharacterized protein n=1 Tax=Croceicoccus marinus TaxID=450378 RepID=A0A1Z1FDP9_9SPHN|nr:hypothetical protein [Croceicoccus marinus]ARU16846.1 hypothetical protein A9D14_12550 [Croceicoccus marinus]